MKRLLLVCGMALMIFVFGLCAIFSFLRKDSSSATKQSVEMASEGVSLDESTEANQGENAFKVYREKGYTVDATGFYLNRNMDDNTYVDYRSCYTASDGSDCVIIQATLKREEYEKYGDYEFPENVPSDKITVISMKDQIPTEEELNQYVGKTIGDLGDNWFFTDDGEGSDDDGEGILQYENLDTGLVLELNVTGGDSNVVEMSEKEMSKLKIKEIRFIGFDSEPDMDVDSMGIGDWIKYFRNSFF